MKKKTNDTSKFVMDFLESNKTETVEKLIETWKSDETQKKLKKIVKKFPDNPKAIATNLAVNETSKILPKPKKNTSSYILFCKDYRKQVTENNPDIPQSKILTKVAELWKEKKENDKETVLKYEKMAEEDKLRYKNDMEKYNKAISEPFVSVSDEPPVLVEEISVKVDPAPEILSKKEKNQKVSYKSESESYDNSGSDRENSDVETESVSGDDSDEEDDDDEESEYESSKIDEIKAFHIFLVKKTRKLKKLYPELSSKEINENLNRVWNKLSSSEKADIIDRYLYK